MEVASFDIFFVEGYCSFCFNNGHINKSTAAVSLVGLQAACDGCIARADGDYSIAHSCATEICTRCLGDHCRLHGSKPIIDGFVCHSCSSYRRCRNRHCQEGLFRGCMKEKFCASCSADRILLKREKTSSVPIATGESKESWILDIEDSDSESESETSAE